MFTDINVTIGELYSVPVHESVSVGRAPVREEEGDLVRGHGHQRDEVPEHVRVLQVRHLRRDSFGQILYHCFAKYFLRTL